MKENINKMGRPRLNSGDDNTMVDVKVKQMIRWLGSGDNPSENIDSAQTVDSELSMYFEKGFSLRQTVFVGQNANGAFGFLYILVKNA